MFCPETIEIKSRFYVINWSTGENVEQVSNKELMAISTAESYQCEANYLCWDTQLISITVRLCCCGCTVFANYAVVPVQNHTCLDLCEKTTEHHAELQRRDLGFLNGSEVL